MITPTAGRCATVLIRITWLIVSIVAVKGLTTVRTQSKGNSAPPTRNRFSLTTLLLTYHRNVSLTARWKRPYYYDEDNTSQGSEQREKALESFKPPTTLTQTMIPSPATFPPKPKIVVLGATGRVGRLVVRQLLHQCEDGTTIVAFCRDYDKACRVLFDDERQQQMMVRGRGKQTGPTLQIVQGNLVLPEELPGYCEQDDEDDDNDNNDEEGEWQKRAKRAAAFYRTKVQDYDNRPEHSNGTNETTDAAANANNHNGGCDDALQEALRDCTVIISCVGTVRPTNIWTDWISWPVWRLLQKDVSGWCRDVRHPYYVHYASMRKVLGYAEREQLRREAVVTLMNSKNKKDHLTANHNHQDGSSLTSSNNLVVVPRIRFIRISDLCVSQKPWDLVPLLTNALHSMVFRYQEMTERLLEESTLLDTIVLRPGDLIDEERDVNTTALQVHTSGKVPCPARVSRSDVAALAVASALFSTHNPKKKGNGVPHSVKANDDLIHHTLDQTDSSEAFHYTLAVRWVGQHMHPYPAQGQKQDGYRDADTCLRHALKILRKRQKNHADAAMATREHRLQNYLPATIARQVLQRRRQRRRLQPYGLCTAIPVYLFLTLALRSLSKALFGQFIELHQPAWMVPVVVKVHDITTMLVSLVIGQLYVLRQITPVMPPWLIRQGGKKYITF